MSLYFVRANRVIHGPYTSEQVDQMTISGDLTPDAEVREDGSTIWMTVSEFCSTKPPAKNGSSMPQGAAVTQYFVSHEGAVLGPLDEIQIRSGLNTGRFSHRTQIRPEGQDRWVPITNHFDDVAGSGAAKEQLTPSQLAILSAVGMFLIVGLVVYWKVVLGIVAIVAVGFVIEAAMGNGIGYICAGVCLFIGFMVMVLDSTETETSRFESSVSAPDAGLPQESKDELLTRFQHEHGISELMVEAAIWEWVLTHHPHETDITVSLNYDLEEVKAICLRYKAFGIPEQYRRKAESSLGVN